MDIILNRFGANTNCLYAQAQITPGHPITPDRELKSFLGERFDGETGLLYLNARYYDPVLGRFLSPDSLDPIKPGVGTNRYAYSLNDPVNKLAPNGHFAHIGLAAGIGAVVGVVAGAVVEFNQPNSIGWSIATAALSGVIAGGFTGALAASCGGCALGVGTAAFNGLGLGAAGAIATSAAKGGKPSTGTIAGGAVGGAAGPLAGAAVGRAAGALASQAVGTKAAAIANPVAQETLSSVLGEVASKARENKTAQVVDGALSAQAGDGRKNGSSPEETPSTPEAQPNAQPSPGQNPDQPTNAGESGSSSEPSRAGDPAAGSNGYGHEVE